MEIRIATIEDISTLRELANETSSGPKWTSGHYQVALQDSTCHLALIAGMKNESRGFLVASGAGKDWELLNIVVRTDSRRKGTAMQLIQELVRQLQSRQAATLHLEVREENIAAITLYERSGFQLVGRRKKYYSSPEEDALLFRRDLLV